MSLMHPPRSHRSIALRIAHGLSVLGLSVLLTTEGAAQSTASTENKLKEARSALSHVGSERREIEQQLGRADQALKQADARLASASRAVALADAELLKRQQALHDAEQKRHALEASLREQRGRLAQLLRNSYAQGNQVPLRMLLSQDGLDGDSRAMIYHRYLQKQRIAAMQQLDMDVSNLRLVETEMRQQQADLEEQRSRAKELNAQLQRERRTRAQQVAQIRQIHDKQQEKEQRLSRDVRQLEGVLSNLRAQAAREAAQRRREQQAKTGPAASTKTSEENRNPPSPPTGQRVGGGNWPVQGRLIQRYGSRQADGRTHTGLLIEASAGTPVMAVADGTVVFADWMTGYGNILIIDHGSGHLSLYAHNESLLRTQGQRVKRGESIARVGQSGGQGRNALYFELRRNGSPVDPMTWLQR